MTASARLVVKCSSASVCRALISVLTPDNEDAPEGMKLAMTRSGMSVVFEVKADAPSAVLSACLSFLQDVALFEQIRLLSSSGETRVMEAPRG